MGEPFYSEVVLSRRALYQKGVVPIDLIDESWQQACTGAEIKHPGDPYRSIPKLLLPRNPFVALSRSGTEEFYMCVDSKN